MLKPAASSLFVGALAAALTLVSGCDENVKVETIRATPQGDAEPAMAVSCSEKDDGTVCGPERHCLAQKCVFNTCGDGIAADQEQCDDGNALSNDGCTPSCVMELESCPDGELKLVGQECPSADAGSGARPLCPMLTGVKAKRDDVDIRVDAIIQLLPGDTLSVEATAVGSYSRVRWVGGLGAVSPSELNATIYCSAPSSSVADLYLILARADCPNSIAALRLQCQEPPDAGLDATVPDASTGDAGPDGGTQDASFDAGQQDGGHRDASADSGGAIDPFGSTACRTCMRENCTDYADIFKVFQPCFESTVSSAFSKLCTDAFVCSRRSANQCAVAPLGSVECFCGLGVAIDTCVTTASGTCKEQWYAAAECSSSSNPNQCVIDNFSVESKPSGMASLALECRQTYCLSDCP